MNSKPIYVVSDALGETAEKVLKVALTQFPDESYDLRRYAFVESVEDMHPILDQAEAEQAMVFYTLVQYAWRRSFDEMARARGIMVFDLMGPLLHSLGVFLEAPPAEIPGVQYRMDSHYFARMDAIEFAVRYDDGKDPRGTLKADVVLLGISRTSKTPLSMYLAGQSLKVANIPLLPEVALPAEIYDVAKEKVFGLTNDLNELIHIRRTRLRQLGFADDGNYADGRRVQEELRYAQEVFSELGCPVINVSGLAVEETASIILRTLEERKRL